ncbi:MAG: GTP cyclohydrolase II [Polyangiaceae bacterium]|nr:GTP cyclohydrolase II [Polyangiaceae bacterium]
MYVPPVGIRPQLKIVAQTTLPTTFGPFEMVVFHWEADQNTDLPRDHVALVRGDVRGRRNVPVRVHSECMTSEVFGSLKCDCREQLHTAQQEIARRNIGVLLYLRQEGRGIGLPNKIRAYQLQSHGHDTVDANRLLGLPDDARDYTAAAAMIEHLGIASIELMTNNPEKEGALRALGISVEGRAPSLITPNAFSAPYLEAKRVRMGHALPFYGAPESIDMLDTCPSCGDAE